MNTNETNSDNIIVIVNNEWEGYESDIESNTCDEYDSDEFDDGTWNDKGVDQKVYCLISTCIISCLIMILIYYIISDE